MAEAYVDGKASKLFRHQYAADALCFLVVRSAVRSSLRCSSIRPLITPVLPDAMSLYLVYSTRISMKLATNIQHVKQIARSHSRILGRNVANGCQNLILRIDCATLERKMLRANDLRKWLLVVASVSESSPKVARCQATL